MGRARGVELRDKSIRVVFIWQGKQRREKLDLMPTPANIKFAERLVVEIKLKISIGTFDYALTIPNSPHAAESLTDTPTFAAACALWLETKGRLAAATLSQYKNVLEFWKVKFGPESRIDQITHGKIAAIVGGHPLPLQVRFPVHYSRGIQSAPTVNLDMAIFRIPECHKDLSPITDDAESPLPHDHAA